MGFRKFNIMPAMFQRWSIFDAKELSNQLSKISDFTADNEVYIKNKDVLQRDYLTNSGYVIDCNGDIYSSNKIMIEQYAGVKDKFKIGNVNDNEMPKFPSKKLVIDDEIHRTNLAIDRILTSFVQGLPSPQSQS